MFFFLPVLPFPGLVWDSSVFVLLRRKNSWEVWGTPVPNQRFYHEQHDFFYMAHRSMIWWFIGWTVDHPYLKSNHQRVQVWIRHQKFTNRSFYIKNLIKKNRSSFPDEQGSTLSTKTRVLQVEYLKCPCWQSLCLSPFPRNTYCSIAKNAKSAMLILFSFQNLKFLGDSLGNDWKKCEK